MLRAARLIAFASIPQALTQITTRGASRSAGNIECNWREMWRAPGCADYRGRTNLRCTARAASSNKHSAARAAVPAPIKPSQMSPASTSANFISIVCGIASLRRLSPPGRPKNARTPAGARWKREIMPRLGVHAEYRIAFASVAPASYGRRPLSRLCFRCDRTESEASGGAGSARRAAGLQPLIRPISPRGR